MVLYSTIAVVILAFAIPRSRRAIIVAVKKLATPLPPDFWDMEEFRGEHMNERNSDDRR